MTLKQFQDIKLEAKTHTVPYLVMKYELLGINLTEQIITDIKMLSYNDFVAKREGC